MGHPANPQRAKAKHLLLRGWSYKRIRSETTIHPRLIYSAANDLRQQGVNIDPVARSRESKIKHLARNGTVGDILSKLTDDEFATVSKMRGETWAEMLVNYMRTQVRHAPLSD